MSQTAPRYWVIVASKDHVKAGAASGIAQSCHGRSAPLRKMGKGDYVIYYSARPTMASSEKCREFTALGQVSDGTVYLQQVHEGCCPYRRSIHFLPSRDISILPLITDLQFIKDKRHWGFPLRYGFLEINQHDFDLIASQMLKNE